MKIKNVNYLTDIKSKNIFNTINIKYGFCGKKESYKGHYCHQEHGTNITYASEQTEHSSEIRVKADGIWTDQKSIRIAIKTADCLPILLCTENSKIIMALHAGWRGLTKGIIGKGIELIKKKQPTSHIFAVLGPAITAPRYEVQNDVITAAHSKTLNLNNEQASLSMIKGKANKWHFDLATAATFDLINRGLLTKNINIISSCTFKNSSLWYSYRRSKIHEGSNWSWIEIN